MLKRAKGVYTPSQINRCAELSGGSFRDLLRLFSLHFGNQLKFVESSRKASTNEDVLKFVRSYSADGLFDHIPGRQHESFPAFQHRHIVRDPAKLGKKLVELSKKMDKERNRIIG